MHQISAIRFQQMERLEAERGPVYEGMCLLMDAIGRVQKDHGPSPARKLAEARLSKLMGEAEERNKSLCQEAGDMWRLILDLDGEELTSPEIAAKERAVADGRDWLSRIARRIAGDEDDGAREDSLRAIAEIDCELHKSWRDLREAQGKHQFARAELLASRLLHAYVN